MQLLVHLWIPTLFFLKLCCAEDIPCTCSEVGGNTQCSVPEFIAAGCEYQWTNGSKSVMADDEEKDDKRVLSKSNRTLVTRGCSPLSLYSCTCFSEGIERKATCTSNCSSEVQSTKKNELPNWVVPVCVSVLVVLLVLVLVVLYMRGIISCCKKKYNVAATDEEQQL